MPGSDTIFLDTRGTSAPSTVSWQTAYWTLVPLAISTMTQPSGRICGRPSRYRTYIRALPLICAFDVLSIAMRLVYHVCLAPHRVGIRRSIDLVFRARFADAAASEDGIQSVEELTVLRWLFFAIGTAPPAVKMMAMTGLPWTKAWAMMYLISFLVVEIMVVLRKSEKAADSSRDSREHQQRGSKTALDTFGRTVDITCFTFGLALQILTLAWALLDFWPGPVDATVPFTAWRLGFGILVTASAIGAGFGVSCGLFFPVAFIVTDCFPPLRRLYRLLTTGDGSGIPEPDSFALEPAAIISLLLGIPASIWVVYIFISQAETAYIRPREYLLDTGIATGVALGIAVQYQVVAYVARRQSLLGRNLLVRFQEIGSFNGDGSPWEYVDTGACWWLVCFVSSFIIFTLWYSARYDPSETTNPGWTGVFG